MLPARLVVIALACIALAGAAWAQGIPPSLPSGTWVAKGDGACEGRPWGQSYATETPDPRQCRPGSNGLVALCFDEAGAQKARNVGSAPVTPGECAADGPRGKIYECRAATVPPERIAQERCHAEMSTPWTAAGRGYSLTLVVDGPTCDGAVGFLTVRAPDGSPLWSSPAIGLHYSLAFQDVSRADLEKAMSAVLNLTPGNGGRTADKVLPDWPDGDASRSWRNGDAQWYVKEGVTPREWRSWRTAKAPILGVGLGQETYFLFVLDADGKMREAGFVVP